MLTSKEVVEKFQSFFTERNHQIINSSSLIPPIEDGVLFTTSGMHPLTPYLLGEVHPEGRKLVNVQRCLRTTDLEEVGDKTHLTFFQMLGNWSLGSKLQGGFSTDESLTWSIESLESLGVKKTSMFLTVFSGGFGVERDQETIDVVTRLGLPFLELSKENWWSNGPTGPCGPDCEIFVWTGESEPEGNPETDTRWVEVWNNVMMRYYRHQDGSITKLLQPNIDTGMGLERLMMVLEKQNSVFETEPLKPFVEEFTSRGLSQENLRIVSDHLRSSLVMLSDGVTPSPTKRGYVLRRLVRKILVKMWLIDPGFSFQNLNPYLLEKVEEMTNVKPQVEILLEEERKFKKVLGTTKKQIEKITSRRPLTEEDLKNLHSTYGIPREISEEFLQ